MRKVIALTLQQLTYRVITALLVMWMALFAPATCLHHGFLLRVLPAPAAIGAPVAPDLMTLMVHAQHMGSNADEVAPVSSPTFTPMLHHQTLGGEISIMVLLAIAMPPGLPLPAPRPTMVWVENREHLNSVTYSPPIRPPRLG